MTRFSTTPLNLIKGLLFTFVMATAMYSCEKEVIKPETTEPAQLFAGVPGLVRPNLQCGASVFSNLSDGVINVGSVEMLNSANNFYILFDLNLRKYIDEVKIFVGDKTYLPLDADANALVENFPYQYSLGTPANEYTFTVPMSDMDACDDVVIWARVKTLNNFGYVTNTQTVWMAGNPFAGAYTLPFCVTSCFTGNGGNPSAE